MSEGELMALCGRLARVANGTRDYDRRDPDCLEIVRLFEEVRFADERIGSEDAWDRAVAGFMAGVLRPMLAPKAPGDPGVAT